MCHPPEQQVHQPGNSQFCCSHRHRHQALRSVQQRLRRPCLLQPAALSCGRVSSVPARGGRCVVLCETSAHRSLCCRHPHSRPRQPPSLASQPERKNAREFQVRAQEISALVLSTALLPAWHQSTRSVEMALKNKRRMPTRHREAAYGSGLSYGRSIHKKMRGRCDRCAHGQFSVACKKMQHQHRPDCEGKGSGERERHSAKNGITRTTRGTTRVMWMRQCQAS